jgi:pyrimidine-nucleoside phosphorylase
MRMTDLIARKRDGGALTPEEIAFFVGGFTRGDVPDYQASALLMAAYLRGMDAGETTALTRAMAESGGTLDLSCLPPGRPTLDKHSTGGVGDKTSLVVVPVLAAAGALVCKMSGRGLGHTGGTLDKLEAIPGFRVEQSPDEMLALVREIGACLTGQTADLAPADKKIYALRDATATVGSLPLIVSSILSKKLAGGARSFVFDVKTGSGALMKTLPEAEALARALVDGAKANGREAVALITDMSQPLGRAVGNGVEVAEAIRALTPGAEGVPPRSLALCDALAAEGLRLVGLADGADADARARELRESGAALAVLRKLVASQGGDPRVTDDPDLLPVAPVAVPIPAPADGYVAAVNAEELGNVCVALGGGRARKEDTIDPAVGLLVDVEIGQAVATGQPLARVLARTEAQAQSVAGRVRDAFRIAEEPVGPPPLVHAVIR